MKKIVIVLVFVLIAVFSFAQETDAITVGYWVFMEEGYENFHTRVVNEFKSSLESDKDWNMVALYREWDSDIHVIISGVSIPEVPAFAWSVTYTPIHVPHFTNGDVYLSEHSISGMNWIARSAVQFVNESLYILWDNANSYDNNESAEERM